LVTLIPKESLMELKCSICKRKIDIEKELAVFFECYVYCDKCLERMEKEGTAEIGKQK
jgi:hypothetical protein